MYVQLLDRLDDLELTSDTADGLAAQKVLNLIRLEGPEYVYTAGRTFLYAVSAARGSYSAEQADASRGNYLQAARRALSET
ncbi:hypothetical protein ABZ926_35735 [Streptomyces litmocidini]|uniref:hypothetical protein n=1 Tax=Streptomyces litmocidini TaxID=67318 RepID=UPI0033C0CEEF